VSVPAGDLCSSLGIGNHQTIAIAVAKTIPA